jgi:hypothetical protein
MKKYFTVVFCLINLVVHAQTILTKAESKKNVTGKYFTFNPLGLVEPHLTVGLGFGNKVTKRSGYFTEFSYLTNGALIKNIAAKINGYRFIAQYRYHFTGYNFIKSTESFAAIEFRLKRYNFPESQGTFVNASSRDTLKVKDYNAQITSYGGTLIIGGTYL